MKAFYNTTFLQLLQHRANDSSPILFQDGKKIYAKDVLEQAQRVAANLKHRGMQKGDLCVLAFEPGPDFLIICFATMLLKVKIAIIDPEMGRENYAAKLKQLKPQWAFIDYRLLLLQEHPIARFLYFRLKKNGLYFPSTKGIKTVAVGKWLPILQKKITFKRLLKETQILPLQLHAENYDYIIIYTSGTVSVPKGVLHSMKSLSRSIELIIDMLQVKPNQKLATHLPHFMLIGACSGVQVQLWDYTMTPDKKLNFIEKHSITTLFGPPSDYLDLIDECEKQSRLLPACLQHIICGSAPVHVPFLTKLVKYVTDSTKITCMYGMTEHLMVAVVDGREKAMTTVKGDLLGTPAQGVDIRIAKDDEILVKSDQLFTRYLHLSERDAYHASGDLGYIDDYGNLVLTGRKKDMIIRRNFNLYPGLYETTIKKIEGINEAVFVGIYDDNIADEIVYLVIDSKIAYSAEDIMKKLQQGRFSIDKEAWPDHIICQKIPRKGRQNKIDKNLIIESLKQSI